MELVRSFSDGGCFYSLETGDLLSNDVSKGNFVSLIELQRHSERKELERERDGEDRAVTV